MNVNTAPDLLTPGISAKHWLKPIKKDPVNVIVSRFLILKQNLSIKYRTIPKIILLSPIIRSNRSLFILKY